MQICLNRKWLPILRFYIYYLLLPTQLIHHKTTLRGNAFCLVKLKDISSYVYLLHMNTIL